MLVKFCENWTFLRKFLQTFLSTYKNTNIFYKHFDILLQTFLDFYQNTKNTKTM